MSGHSADTISKRLVRVEPRGRLRLMIPREHGAYAELLFPMTAVMLGGVPTASTWLLATSAIACFMANEPLLVLFGQRGARARREQGGRAVRAILFVLLIAIVCGIAGLSLAPPRAQYWVLLPLLLGVALILMAVQGLERRFLGEVTAAAALSSLAVPLGLTAKLSLGSSLSVASIWLVASLLGTFVVRLTVARTRAKTDSQIFRVRAKSASLVLASLLVVGLGFAAPLAPRGPLWVLAAALPVAIAVLVLVVAKPSARSLRSVGWGLVLANLCTLIAVVVALWITADIAAVRATLPFPMF